jgi:hypothetical protein
MAGTVRIITVIAASGMIYAALYSSEYTHSSVTPDIYGIIKKSSGMYSLKKTNPDITWQKYRAETAKIYPEFKFLKKPEIAPSATKAKI